jgi:polyhydroxybutyrate depolymerase
MKPRLFRRIVAFLFSITLLTAYGSIQAQERSIPEKKLLGDNSGELSDQGRLRTYYIHTPKSYNPDRPMPLVLVFHGDNGTGRSISDVSRFNDLAEQKGFIAVYPDAIDHRWSLRANSSRKVDDVLFVTALINHLQEVRNIDSHRIYATGFSKDGILTQALACKLPNKIAAFASVAGSLPVRLKPSCQPQTSVSMLMINGTNDKDVHYQGDDTTQRGALVSIPEAVNFWQSHNQCTSPTEDPQQKNPSSSDRTKVTTSRYSDCNGNSEVFLANILGGGHFWPGGASSDEDLNKFNAKLGFDASQNIWNFFQSHSLP